MRVGGGGCLKGTLGPTAFSPIAPWYTCTPAFAIFAATSGVRLVRIWVTAHSGPHLIAPWGVGNETSQSTVAQVVAFDKQAPHATCTACATRSPRKPRPPFLATRSLGILSESFAIPCLSGQADAGSAGNLAGGSGCRCASGCWGAGGGGEQRCLCAGGGGGSGCRYAGGGQGYSSRCELPVATFWRGVVCQTHVSVDIWKGWGGRHGRAGGEQRGGGAGETGRNRLTTSPGFAAWCSAVPLDGCAGRLWRCGSGGRAWWAHAQQRHAW